MKVLSLCMLVLMASLAGLAHSRRLRLGTCTVNAHTSEMRRYYNEMRTDVLRRDTEMTVRFLSPPTLRGVEEGESCCFLNLLIRFYVERVFSGYSASGSEDQRSASALANTLLLVRRDLKPCNCQCKEETHRLMDSVHSEFIKLNVTAAAVKAVGELDTVLDWLDGFRHPQPTGLLERK